MCREISTRSMCESVVGSRRSLHGCTKEAMITSSAPSALWSLLLIHVRMPPALRLTHTSIWTATTYLLTASFSACLVLLLRRAKGTIFRSAQPTPLEISKRSAWRATKQEKLILACRRFILPAPHTSSVHDFTTSMGVFARNARSNVAFISIPPVGLL